MDVWEYFQTRDREVAEQSAAWDDAIGPPYTEEAGSDGKRGRIFGRVVLSEHAFLQVHEVVQVVDSGVHRREYAYYFTYRGAEIWGEERDLSHTPAVHRHDREHRRYVSNPISFNEALSRAWSDFAAEEDLRATTVADYGN